MEIGMESMGENLLNWSAIEQRKSKEEGGDLLAWVWEILAWLASWLKKGEGIGSNGWGMRWRGKKWWKGGSVGILARKFGKLQKGPFSHGLAKWWKSMGFEASDHDEAGIKSSGNMTFQQARIGEHWIFGKTLIANTPSFSCDQTHSDLHETSWTPS